MSRTPIPLRSGLRSDVTGGNINTNLVQQQIYRPDTSLFRWLGSLGVDSFGDMALCYSTSNATAPNYPSIQCAGRLATDPLGQLPQGETEYIAGAGSQVFDCGGGTCQRWGDYSSTTVDPIDDCTFLVHQHVLRQPGLGI